MIPIDDHHSAQASSAHPLQEPSPTSPIGHHVVLLLLCKHSRVVVKHADRFNDPQTRLQRIDQLCPVPS